MKKAALALTFAMMMLLPAVYVSNLFDMAQSQSAKITINADGSVTPSTAPITTVDGINYNFAGNVVSQIWINRSNMTIDGNGYRLQSANANGFYLFHISNVTIKNLNIEKCDGKAFLFGDSSNNTICYNNITSNGYGVYLEFSSHGNSVYGNNITNNGYGIMLSSGASHNSIHDNIVSGNTNCGIELISQTAFNKVYGNNITGNGRGVDLIYSASNNEFFLNNFVNNGGNAVASLYMGECLNKWDNGSLGNYWSDYNGTDLNHDGLGDKPYIVLVAHNASSVIREEHNNTDNYPLMNPFDIESNSVIPPSNNLFTFSLILAIAVSIFAVGIGLLVYFKKRKHVAD